MTENEARRLTLNEVLTTAGRGWVENWLRPEGLRDPGDKIVLECCWLYGAMIERAEGYDYVDFSDRALVEQQYGQRYGLRIWTARPSDALRESTPWAP